MNNQEELETENPGPPTKRGSDPHIDQHCPFCGMMKLDRQRKQGTRDQLFSLICLYPYRCRKCCRHTTRFHLGLRFWLQAIAFVSTLVLAAWAINSALTHEFATANAQAAEKVSHIEAVEGVRNNMGQLSPYEKMLVSKHQQTMDNDTIIRLTKSNVGAPIILKMIRGSNHEFDVSANAIISLKAAGVDESIIFTMLDVSSDPR